MSNRSALKASVVAAIRCSSVFRLGARPIESPGFRMNRANSGMKRRKPPMSRISLEHSTLASYRLDVAGFADQLH
jgi:hypothetical protein